MANNYYDATGVLVLDRVTPVITALFGGFKLDASHPGDGQAYIALVAEDNNPSWVDLCAGLSELATSLGLPLPDDSQTVEPLLASLSLHFGADQDEALAHLIEHHLFEDAADLDALFLIATRFDDGHGLQEIRFEGCWHCSKPRLFNFGGDAQFFSREFVAYCTSGQALQLGDSVRQALLRQDLEAVASHFTREVQRLLAGIQDESVRVQTQKRLSSLLH
ncbi:TPA: hypothetical protein RVE07_000113 [Escherichia coli]|jgi:hypothetical protein|uniref:hypothetical protein n=1 Tax=Pseudomonadota TaxID=1224 RepID=UPI00089DAC10|nr:MULTISPECIES: hypothetical protein [Pseudomonadota]EFE7737402.1 hypothetical protein [Escherichia coli]EJA9920196.1 hypothetical protein [Pseudomonas aeruginosa]MBK3430821.1 hypothetical protein [Pseudomonas fluorescens]AUT46444.1 hypothetical protein C2U31_10865 [Achromobacter sp. AONIH1]AUY33102.1 hypothetical protein C3F42_07685 [Pseudomonas sp. PONIH3]